MEPRPPERIDLGDVVLRRYVPDDAARLAAVARANLDHLSPWMTWATVESTTEEAMARFIAESTGRIEAGLDAGWGILDREGRLLGGTGLHDRVGPGGVEIGYWLAASATGRGVITRVAGALTDLALGLHGTTRVEIHCDEANHRSAAVPHRLGYRLERIVPSDRPQAPSDTGRDMIWVRTEPIAGAAAV